MKKPGPFKIIEHDGNGNLQAPIAPPIRRYDCPHYSVCLNLSAALDWDSFTCRGCIGQVDQALYWRARQAQKQDNVADRICEIPAARIYEAPDPPKPQNKLHANKNG